MSNNMTTTGHIRVEDVTFRGARQQKQVIEDLADKYGIEPEEVGKVKAPVSLTPEAVKTFYVNKIEETIDPQEKKIYAQTIKWIDECLETKKKLVAIELKYHTSEEDTPEDI